MTLPRALALVVASLLVPACGLNTLGPVGSSLLDAATLQLSFSPIKQFDFTWAAVPGAEHYALLERISEDGEYQQIGGDVVGQAISLTMPLHLRFGASYILRACDSGGCTDSEPVDVVDSMAAAVGYFKAATPGEGSLFGYDVAVSADGGTMAVGAFVEEDSGAVHVFAQVDGVWSLQDRLKAPDAVLGDNFGVSVALSADGDTLAVGANGKGSYTGGVYVFERASGVWSHKAYLQASNSAPNTAFGRAVALSADGDMLAVGSDGEMSAATGIDGDETDIAAPSSGAVYTFVRSNNAWSQQAYLKASNTDASDGFGIAVAMSAGGNFLAVGAPYEDSADIDNQFDESALKAGAVYVFEWSNDAWSQRAYLKASNPYMNDYFGFAVAMSGDGDTLAVGAYGEGSAVTGGGGDQSNHSISNAGAVYVLVRSGAVWSQQAYLKASNADGLDSFGRDVAISDDGHTLAVGASGERSAASGVGGDQADDAGEATGAVYVLARSGDVWAQRGYVKASNAHAGASFGISVAMSKYGDTLAVGACFEDSAATDIGGDQSDHSAPSAGAVYLY